MDCDCGIRHRRTPPHVRLLRTRPRPTDERTSRVGEFRLTGCPVSFRGPTATHEQACDTGVRDADRFGTLNFVSFSIAIQTIVQYKYRSFLRSAAPQTL